MVNKVQQINSSAPANNAAKVAKDETDQLAQKMLDQVIDDHATNVIKSSLNAKRSVAALDNQNKQTDALRKSKKD